MSQVEKEEKQIAVMETDSQRMISVVEQASLNPDVNPEKLKQLLDIQIIIMDRQSKIEFDQAMAECQLEMSNLKILKETKNTQTDSTYAKHEAICAAIKPIYSRHGFRLSFSEGKADNEGEIRTNCIVTHRLGHSESYYIDLPADGAGIKGTVNKTPVHAKASTFSYGRRYLTLMIFDLATYDDNDANRPPVERITEEQALEIHAKITDNKLNMAKFIGWMKKAMKCDSIENLPAQAFKTVISEIDATIKRKESREAKNEDS